MTSPRRTVLFGVGRMGRNHLRVISESAHFELVGIVDPEFEKLAEHDLPQNVKSVKKWKSVESCLSECQFEVAVVAAPTQHHFQIAQTLISAGKHLLMEKPLATTYDEALQLVELSKRGKTILKVGHLERLNPAVRKLKEVVQNGWVGTPIHFSFTRVGGYPNKVTGSNNVLMDLAVHDVDVLHFLTGLKSPFEILGVAAHSTWQPGILDTAEVLLKNSESISASIHVNWVTPTKIRTLRVTGTRGVCMVDYILQTCVLYGGDLLRNRHEPKVSFEELLRLYQNSDRIEFGVEREEPLKLQLREFDKALNGELSLVCDGTEGAQAVDIVQRSLHTSDQEKKVIQWTTRRKKAS